MARHILCRYVCCAAGVSQPGEVRAAATAASGEVRAIGGKSSHGGHVQVFWGIKFVYGYLGKYGKL